MLRCSLRVAKRPALVLRGRMLAVIKAHARQKLRRRVLRQVVKQPLPEDARLRAMRDNLVPVTGDRGEMTDKARKAVHIQAS